MIQLGNYRQGRLQHSSQVDTGSRRKHKLVVLSLCSNNTQTVVHAPHTLINLIKAENNYARLQLAILANSHMLARIHSREVYYYYGMVQ